MLLLIIEKALLFKNITETVKVCTLVEEGKKTFRKRPIYFKPIRNWINDGFKLTAKSSSAISIR